MDGTELAKAIRLKVAEFRKLCEGIDETTASRAPEGRWSPKEIVSHLLGPEQVGMMPLFRAFLDRDTPKLDLAPGNPHFTEARARMTFAQLLAAMEQEYGAIAEMVSRLSPEQLDRKAYVPELKESPMGEYPTLGAFVGAIAELHLGFHIDHMGEILRDLGR